MIYIRRFVISTFCLGLLALPAPSQATNLVRRVVVAQNSGLESDDPIPDTRPEPRTSAHAGDVTCQTVGVAALVNDLAVEFLTRLIWQESQFDARAVSRAGAQGIAQFMPGTAAEVGLANPFEATDAINKSAALLREFKQKFGNLGLAAAAYNAGPKRVEDWLARRRSLPR